MFRNIYTLMFCGITLLACHSHSHQEDEHEEEPLLISVYSDDYEVFAEAEPFETGKKSRVLAHFTTLNNFKPLDSAEVTMILMVNGIEIKQTASKALRSGIYEFFFEPKHSGKGNLVAEVLKNGVLVSIPLGDISCCGGHDGVHHHEEKGGVTDGIVFTKEQSWKIDFATQVPTPKKFGAIFKSAAKVSASNTDFSYVCARTSGFVRFVDDEFMAGRVVESQRDVLHISGNGLRNNFV